ncbi:hypothetical protein CGMCC3_g14432 [Colletotrichum fructicola]|nr:uncharacterized protein CGMCC3_g14432 [Colletotrichum fructicola]KAE9569382.1 hypothetical protein CGMCC3_g14432 [Colletotrichum fructicola]
MHERLLIVLLAEAETGQARASCTAGKKAARRKGYNHSSHTDQVWKLTDEACIQSVLDGLVSTVFRREFDGETHTPPLQNGNQRIPHFWLPRMGRRTKGHGYSGSPSGAGPG